MKLQKKSLDPKLAKEIEKESELVPIQLYIPRDLKKAFKTKASQDLVPMSTIFQRLIRDYVENA